MAKQTTPRPYRVTDEVHEAIKRLAEIHGGVDNALREALIEHPKHCAATSYPEHLKPLGQPIERSPDLDQYLADERESRVGRPRYDVKDATSILVEEIPDDSPEGRLREELR